MGCEFDSQLKKWILDSAFILPDGIGIQWAIYWLAHHKIGCITGIQLVLELLRRGGFSCMFIGASPLSYQQAMVRVKDLFPRVTFIAGAHGYYSEKQWPDIIHSIQAKAPDLILVGMGFPMQERFLQLVHQHCSHGVGMGVGGVIDILSGYSRWAPAWIRSLKLEWLYRGLCRPQRLKTWGFMLSFIRWLFRNKGY